ncbi:protein PSP2 [Cimex lectularius]|uniref:Caprin n=1 Tax=Cimex lectularius TaxID=79782 RepID=A0A8I6SRX3_CIMLE|nr:protein PSP2 [Cimex lectularius]
MPTASVGRLEKQASIDAWEPLRQGITMIEHKIRNLEKRKARLDSCRDLQKSGKDLNSDQVEAISKYDAVIQHLDFARELSKQLTALANDSTKTLKKQARKEAAEKAQQDFNRTKEILIIQVFKKQHLLQFKIIILFLFYLFSFGQSRPSATQLEIRELKNLFCSINGLLLFLTEKENELDTPESGEQPSSIPTMTYTNQNYGAPMVDHHPVVQPPPAEAQQYQNQQTDEEKGWKTVTSNSIETTVIEATSSPVVQNTNAWTNNSTLVMDQTQNRQRQNSNSGGAGGEDWASQTEHWQQAQQNTNDGFIPAGGNRGRGGRGRGGGGGDRNNKGGFQKGGRGGSNQSGRGGFNREGGFRGDRSEGGYRDRGEGYNRESGGYRNDGGYFNKDQNSGGGGSYQNGYQSGARGGGARSNRSNQSTDRPGGGRGGNRGGRGSGSYRGGNPSGNYRQQQVQ